MSTTPVDTWAVDLANVTVIYPFAGSEMIMAVAGVAAWIVWHIWQVKFENRTYDEQLRTYATEENLKTALDEVYAPKRD